MTLEEFLRKLEEGYNLLSTTKIKINLPIEIKEYKLNSEEYNDLQGRYSKFELDNLRLDNETKTITLT